MTTEVIAWHFAGTTLRDGSPLPPAGVELPEIVDPLPCMRGYHGSLLPLDALRYAPGSMVARVRLHGCLIVHGDPPDKHVSSRRCGITDYVDASEALKEFSRWCALSVAHCWEMPDVVRQYLETGDESIRNAAWDAAWAARASDWASSRDVAWAATWATRAATWASAMPSTWASARASAEDVAGNAARAARAAVRVAYWDSEAVQNDRLEIILTAIVDTRVAS